MALKDILIKDCALQKVSTSQSKLNLVVYPLDENGDLEPWVVLKVYINDSLAKNLTANEFWDVKENFLINNVWDDVKVQIRDVSENVRSKIKIVLGNNSDKSDANNYNQSNSSHFDQAKQEAIAQLKAEPMSMRSLTEEQKNDIDIVKYAIMQRWSLIRYAWSDVKKNKEIAKIALKQDRQSFYHISDLLKTDIDFVLELLNEFWDIFCLPDYVRNDTIIQKWLLEFYKNQSEFGTIKIKYFSEHNSLYNKDINLKRNIETLESQFKSIDNTIRFNSDILNKKSDFFILYNNISNLEEQINDLAYKKKDLSGRTWTILWLVLFGSSINSIQNKLNELQTSFNNSKNALYNFTQSNWLQWLFFSDGFSISRNRQIVEKRRDDLHLRIEKDKNNFEIINKKNNDLKLQKDNIQSYNLNKQKEDFVSLYKRFKKQYPFFIDYEIEQML